MSHIISRDAAIFQETATSWNGAHMESSIVTMEIVFNQTCSYLRFELPHCSHLFCSALSVWYCNNTHLL
jgi:hypothetical protein